MMPSTSVKHLAFAVIHSFVSWNRLLESTESYNLHQLAQNGQPRLFNDGGFVCLHLQHLIKWWRLWQTTVSNQNENACTYQYDINSKEAGWKHIFSSRGSWLVVLCSGNLTHIISQWLLHYICARSPKYKYVQKIVNQTVKDDPISPIATVRISSFNTPLKLNPIYSTVYRADFIFFNLPMEFDIHMWNTGSFLKELIIVAEDCDRGFCRW